MNIDKESLSYELGVMMFNFTVDEVDTIISFGEYDMIGNFCSIIDALNGEINFEDIKNGFVSEAKNYNIDNKKAIKLFEKSKQRIVDY